MPQILKIIVLIIFLCSFAPARPRNVISDNAALSIIVSQLRLQDYLGHVANTKIPCQLRLVPHRDASQMNLNYTLELAAADYPTGMLYFKTPGRPEDTRLL